MASSRAVKSAHCRHELFDGLLALQGVLDGAPPSIVFPFALIASVNNVARTAEKHQQSAEEPFEYGVHVVIIRDGKMG